MQIRKLIRAAKVQAHDTRWKTGDLPPRLCPIYLKSKPHGPSWQWRSAKANSGDMEFWLVATVNVSRGNWKCVLIVKTESGHSVVARYEDHGSHPGLHVHSHCVRGGVEEGPSGMNDLVRVPPVKAAHRRINAQTLSTFWENARRFFRIKDDMGPLYQ